MFSSKLIEKTKVMDLLENDYEVFLLETLVFEKLDQFKYLGTTIKRNNNWSAIIVSKRV